MGNHRSVPFDDLERRVSSPACWAELRNAAAPYSRYGATYDECRQRRRSAVRQTKKTGSLSHCSCADRRLVRDWIRQTQCAYAVYVIDADGALHWRRVFRIFGDHVAIDRSDDPIDIDVTRWMAVKIRDLYAIDPPDAPRPAEWDVDPRGRWLLHPEQHVFDDGRAMLVGFREDSWYALFVVVQWSATRDDPHRVRAVMYISERVCDDATPGCRSVIGTWLEYATIMQSILGGFVLRASPLPDSNAEALRVAMLAVMEDGAKE